MTNAQSGLESVALSGFCIDLLRRSLSRVFSFIENIRMLFSWNLS